MAIVSGNPLPACNHNNTRFNSFCPAQPRPCKVFRVLLTDCGHGFAFREHWNLGETVLHSQINVCRTASWPVEGKVGPRSMTPDDLPSLRRRRRVTRSPLKRPSSHSQRILSVNARRPGRLTSRQTNMSMAHSKASLLRWRPGPPRAGATVDCTPLSQRRPAAKPPCARATGPVAVGMVAADHRGNASSGRRGRPGLGPGGPGPHALWSEGLTAGHTEPAAAMAWWCDYL